MVSDNFKKIIEISVATLTASLTIMLLFFVLYHQKFLFFMGYLGNHSVGILVVLLTIDLGVVTLYATLNENVEFMKMFIRTFVGRFSFFMTKHKQMIVAIAILLTPLILWVVPLVQVSRFESNLNNTKDIAELENAFRATLAQIIGGFGIFVGLFLTWKRVSAAEKNVEVLEDGQITERFTRAIEQFKSEITEVRLGGIYALGRIASDS
ncbi:hypothetical protein [Methanolobus vulcani]|uniref:Uncharacterized protein n=1 Tax=Methanolobus vulcani TaxID=38026 RepID=A0A7Z8KNN4_9EURY|nr:hypothetical protein [Methanolobus vulcani]TQD24920.1 hypothetical protein FKV42_07560 [Methanolobus vulcani]